MLNLISYNKLCHFDRYFPLCRRLLIEPCGRPRHYWEDMDGDWEAPVEVDVDCEGLAEEVDEGPAEEVSGDSAKE